MSVGRSAIRDVSRYRLASHSRWLPLDTYRPKPSPLLTFYAAPSSTAILDLPPVPCLVAEFRQVWSTSISMLASVISLGLQLVPMVHEPSPPGLHFSWV